MLKNVLKLAMAMMVVLALASVVPAKDWKTCKTSVIIANTTNTKCVYHVYWLDHDVKEYQGRPIPRCGGEIKAYSMEPLTEPFHLCPGRHIALWWKTDEDGTLQKYKAYKFVIDGTERVVALTPEEIKI